MTREETLRNFAAQVNDFVADCSFQATLHAMALELCGLPAHHTFSEADENTPQYDLYWFTRSVLNQEILREAMAQQHNLFGQIEHVERQREREALNR